ncbi:DNA mismatch repair protein MutS [Paenibacillus sp. LMG 31456]|uniref:DNA mismatch repair protein MutS n=1 Tax=Paenibacillus foliorum TaxID=2654974 RepID=A0A972JZD9_9BACL|nr:DNA mismatch repair protein MutS [Paenibacillus foliorum]NOU91748.1 DNA mismatch repair protein MutS [Paenibacillus foliorum]
MNEKALQRLEYGKVKEILMGYAISYLGKRQIEQMLPMTSGKLMRKKLDETAEAKSLIRHGASVPVPSLEGIENILTLLGTGYVFSEKDFLHIHQFLTSCAQLMRYMAAKLDVAPHISTYAASMYEMDKLKSEINRCIRNGQVTDIASKELLKVRKRISVFEERLKSKLDSLMSKHRSILQENIISTRSGRYVLPIKKEHRKLVKGTVLDESASGQTVFIEPDEIMSFQYELSSLRAEEAREETKVLSDLTALAEESAQQFQVNVETVGTYDFLFAKAKYALAIGGSNVKLNEEGIIELREAKHPLLGNQMVPLHFAIGKKYKSLIITGPNTGGKTLALKTVGLLTVMVQSGLLVPVQEGSLFSVYTNVAVDIGDGQSIEHALSTFSAHIRNVIDILQIADSSTLVLIDEMASGTDPGEGVGLSVAILEELHRREATVVATTHFTEIKNFAAAAPGFENARMEFDAQTLQPLYRLRIGEAGQSYAFLIALKLGIPAEIIHRSREITASGIPYMLPQEITITEQAPLESTGRSMVQQEETRILPRHRTHKEEAEAGTMKPEPVTESFQLGDRVFAAYLGRSGIVCETEDSMGNIGVMIQKQKMKIKKKRLVLQIESKELYPDNYDLDIIFETKQNRKMRKLMNRKHVKGLTIEKRSEE